jgi:diguanylate cyclase (GGDEF)-like protein
MRQDPLSRLVGHRLARRLFLLFVLVAIVPLAFTNWIASLATTQVAEELNRSHRAQTTRHASRQVLDRLLAAKTLLAARADSVETGPPAGLGRVFSQVVRLGGPDAVGWPQHLPADLARAWRQADAGREAGLLEPELADVRLRVDHSQPGAARVLLGVYRDAQLRWIGALDAAYLWGPLADAGLDTAWWVHDAHGHVIAHQAGEDYTLRQDVGPGSAADEVAQSTAALFLAGELGAGDWTFTQRVPRSPVLWHGAPLALWLAAAALAALLAIAALSHWRIRRALQPLEQLTQGTRQLATGAVGTRVEVGRDDELGDLAGAFNEMAARIAMQFDALEGLSAIDRDILAGAAFEQLASHALQRIGAGYPGAGALVVWRDGGLAIRKAWLAVAVEGAGVVMGERVALDAAAIAEFGRLAGDEQYLSRERGGPPCIALERAMRRAGIDRTAIAVLLPLRYEGETLAMLVLGLPAPASDEVLQPAREIRDRLTVALGARLREHELEHRAGHDSLTGLANRFGLHARLETELAHVAQRGSMALLSIDLDHFKDVNDTLGHEAGDELLCAAAQRLQSCVPAGATVARPGGDEFVVLLPGADEAVAAAVAGLVLAALGRPFMLRSGEQRLGASAGIALAPGHGRSREELLRCADIALFAAKGAGRGQHTLFSPELDRAARDRVSLQAELRRAIERCEFVVHYQPRVRPEDGRIVSAEALVRWQHPERGLLFPGAFIAVAEACGLIEEIGLAVLDAACAQMAAWRRDGLGLQRISVNLSPRQLGTGGLPARVREALDRHELPGQALELEITESLMMGDPAATCNELAELRRFGVTVALDDFGTGYSSMAVLRQLPIDVMKIDRSFVVGLGVDDGAMAVARAIVALARSLRLQLVAEGIETEAQAAVLRAMGCDELQGYLFARPLPPAAFEELSGLQRTSAPARLAVVRGRPL